MQPTVEIQPQSDLHHDADHAVDEFLRRAPSAMVSVIIHLIVLIVLAFLSLQIKPKDPLVIQLGEAKADDSYELESIEFEVAEPDVVPEPEEAVPVTVKFDVPREDVTAVAGMMVEQAMMLPQAGPSLGLDETLKGYSPEFSRRILDAKANGIEIVIVFDSTGSMGTEISMVKQRIRQIGESVLRKIPKARFSLATYRDLSDDYVVRGVPLSSDLKQIEYFVGGVVADGGGDRPEAVQAGMTWAMRKNDFRSAAQKVMVIFGDAPPHPSDLGTCLDLAEEFRGYGKGRVYTVTCRNASPLPEFYAIARAGSGDAFLMANVDHLMDDLLVIAFGAENREQVLKFFELDQRQTPERSAKLPTKRRSRRPRRSTGG
ncbi:MAG: VWA domain-containing protein [Planctomycetales bacterium]|nr:VWA domain-containing protein [Planctomycetales bacterium]